MIQLSATYDGGKKCSVSHPEGAVLHTDAPRDIGGDASAFSPTDLVAAALASCILTTMAMWAERNGLDLMGASATVQKEMGGPPRRIAALPVVLTLPASVPEDVRAELEEVGRACPVHKSLSELTNAPLQFLYR